MSTVVLVTTSRLIWETLPLCLLHRKLHQQFELYKDQVKKLGEESQVAQMARAESPTCGICRKTKFADGCGRACCYCQSRFCARCGGRVPLRANKVSVCMQLVGCCMCVNTDRCIETISTDHWLQLVCFCPFHVAGSSHISLQLWAHWLSSTAKPSSEKCFCFAHKF